MSKPTILVGIDDTDNLDSRGTGRLARDIAAELEGEFKVLAVTRHQLLVDPRIPYTSHNSSAAIHLESSAPADLSRSVHSRISESVGSRYTDGPTGARNVC